MTKEEAIQILDPETSRAALLPYAYDQPRRLAMVTEAMRMGAEALRGGADVAPVVHGQWIWRGPNKGYECSRCHSRCLLNYESDWHESPYCPHCGAKMDKDGNNG